MNSATSTSPPATQAYWFPLLFFGLAIAGAAPLYVGHVEMQVGDLYSIPTDPRLGSYWTVTLLGGALLTVWWYRRRGRRVGIEGRVGPALVVPTVVTIMFLVVSALPIGFYLWPLLVRDYTALLVIAVGLAGPVSHPTGGLDEVVHQRHRLGILTIAAEVRRVEFSYLRESLQLTAGNLSRHIAVLAEAGLIDVERGTRESGRGRGCRLRRPAAQRSPPR